MTNSEKLSVIFLKSQQGKLLLARELLLNGHNIVNKHYLNNELVILS